MRALTLNLNYLCHITSSLLIREGFIIQLCNFQRLKLLLLLFAIFVVCPSLKNVEDDWLTWICLIGSSFALDFKKEMLTTRESI
nr:hypothetical protein Iba_chr14bCG17060 [Ipomoea batatas]GMD90264.1 hypothetical protein Iba_chr14dCG7990 [Ipomoea batatas]GMD92557.1 hypothetical protein Iba_chr14eCG10280 [Ipomoea batatas]GME06347.1 hypothetical protein Iba_scaffold3997CG0480 [Ipomoea batatas]